MMPLPQAFTERMKADLGDEAQAFFSSYDQPAARGIRVNTLKLSVEQFKTLSPFALTPVPWEECGFYVDDEKPGKTVYHAAGAYYVQEPSAMCAAPLLAVCPGDTVLDLCSAPGGKGTQLAQAMKGEGVIVLNEINFSRAKILSSNVERLGIENAIVTCAPPAKLAQNCAGMFDKILVDAPCSGEGMFKKEPNAIAEWSPGNVEMCAQRQAEILDCAAQLLAPGGLMVYSTCTFASAEDEEQTAAFLNRHPNFELIEEHKLYPHRVRGEGHYAALLKKNGGEGGRTKYIKPRADRQAAALFADFSSRCLHRDFKNLHSVENRLYSLPDGAFDCGVQTLRAGICLGEVIKGRFEPSHSLAMCLKEGEAHFISLDEAAALKYLSGNTFECDAGINGWAVASYMGLPLGWVKVSGGVAKNHLPKGVRI